MPGVVCDADVEGVEAVLRFTGGEVRLPAAMSEVFGFIALHDAFAVRDLPSTDAIYDQGELVRLDWARRPATGVGQCAEP